jgi:hypothetical protein
MVDIKFGTSFILALTLLASSAKAEVLFEGYARVFSKREPIGYAISKYEFDAKKKRFTAITFLKIEKGANLTESLKAVADEKLRPISYSYTTLVGKETKIIDAKFSGSKMTAMVNTGGKVQTVRNTLPSDTILSTFLTYAILSSPQGIKSKTTFTYPGIAEEKAQLVKDGRAIVGNEEDYKGLKAFKIKNEFEGHFTSYVSARGEVLSTSNDDMSISTELMADAEKATEGFAVNKTVLKALFGEVPEGKNNIVSKSASISTAPAGKQQGIPQGQGVQIKTEPETK